MIIIGSLAKSPLIPFLAKSTGPGHGASVYLCMNNRRHWVSDADRVKPYGFDLDYDVVPVTDAFLDGLLPAQHVPRLWTDTEIASPPEGLLKRDLREIAGARVKGSGLEVGALASPYPLPITTSPIYGDLFTRDELIAHYPDEPAHTMVFPAVRTAFEDLKEINAGTLDFIVASHVIEHARDPIGAIVNAYSKLRDGGSIVLVIPDMRRTFDKDRALTTLDHLIDDYYNPSHERDAENHREFHLLAFPSPEESYEANWRKSWEDRSPIHYHTWVYESFKAMVEYISAELAPFSSIWSHPTLPDNGDANEFYFTLTK